MRTREENNDIPRGGFNEYTKYFMSDCLKITIWKQRVENGYKYKGHILYDSPSGHYYNRDIPNDIGEIAKSLGIHIDIETAKIIYNTIIGHYNDMFVGIQNERNLITEGYVGHNMVDVISFPPFEYFEDEIRRIRRSSERLDTIAVTPFEDTSFADADYSIGYTTHSTNHINYVTIEEFDRIRENGELEGNACYLVINSN